jgi:hypothetical protein
MNETAMIEGWLGAARAVSTETLAWPVALPPNMLAVVVVAAAWLAWDDTRHSVIADLALGLLVSVSAARLVPLSAAALLGCSG